MCVLCLNLLLKKKHLFDLELLTIAMYPDKIRREKKVWHHFVIIFRF